VWVFFHRDSFLSLSLQCMFCKCDRDGFCVSKHAFALVVVSQGLYGRGYNRVAMKLRVFSPGGTRGGHVVILLVKNTG
jgi:hypothetical protein